MFKVNNKDNWTYLTLCSSVSIVNFEQVNDDWEYIGGRQNLHSVSVKLSWEPNKLNLSLQKCHGSVASVLSGSKN